MNLVDQISRQKYIYISFFFTKGYKFEVVDEDEDVGISSEQSSCSNQLQIQSQEWLRAIVLFGQI